MKIKNKKIYNTQYNKNSINDKELNNSTSGKKNLNQKLNDNIK